MPQAPTERTKVASPATSTSAMTEQLIHGDDNVATNGPEYAPEQLSGGGPTRTESDSLGSMEIPENVYWGIHTARALINFPITRRAISNYPDLVRALARVKQASARANKEIGVLDRRRPTSSTRSASGSSTASCTTSSWSASSRAAPAPAPT